MGKPGAIDTTQLESAVEWARATVGTKTHLIVISSDAVFHGPWMFHEENCSGVCQSAPAVAIRRMEEQVKRLCPGALIVRTNAFGWSPLPAGGWLESLLEQISEESPLRAVSDNYATPIEASLLAGILIELWDRKLEGVYHVGGSERVNFVHFAHRLAQEFQLPRPRFQPSRGQDSEASHEFGQGETSLNSGKVRRAVGTPLPMLSESLTQLRELSESGDRHALQADSVEFAAHAA
jgi:dTDP-4-dehydrorhamnose reductase